jgi:predicted metal-dependent hydrolase
VAAKGDDIRHDAIVWAGGTIAYSWCHSRRRTLGITVRPDKSVSVRVPLRTPLKVIREFVSARAEWVLKIWKKQDTRPPRQQQEYDPGALFRFRGEEIRLKFDSAPRLSIQLHDGVLTISAPEQPSDETVRTVIDGWYRKQAQLIVPERIKECHRMMQAEQIPLPPVTIRAMTTRWGSYSYRTRRICLNLRLIMMPPECLDYVIIHELCHIKVRHHGPDFWRMVARYVPDYLKVRRRLTNAV